MREVKFKGLYKGKWYYFDLYQYNKTNSIDAPLFLKYEMEAICQYTGFKDMNGKYIWEGDIIHLTHKKKDRQQGLFDQPVKPIYDEYGDVVWYHYWCYRNPKYAPNPTHTSLYSLIYADIVNVEIIGNIYENTEIKNKLFNQQQKAKIQ